MDSTLTAHEDFIGLYEVDSIIASTLVRILKDSQISFNVSLSKLRGQCFDGASNMSGIRQGVAMVIQAEQLNACFYSLLWPQFKLGHMVKGCATMKKMLDTVQEITKLVKYSPRRQAIFENLKKK